MAGQRIGYIRVSTLDQNTQRQLEGVRLDRLFTDKASGKDVKRPQLVELVKFIREGDTLVVHSMDRLARNLDVWMFALGGGILAALYVVRWESEPSFLEGSVTSPAWKQFFGSYRLGRVGKPVW